MRPIPRGIGAAEASVTEGGVGSETGRSGGLSGLDGEDGESGDDGDEGDEGDEGDDGEPGDAGEPGWLGDCGETASWWIGLSWITTAWLSQWVGSTGPSGGVVGEGPNMTSSHRDFEALAMRWRSSLGTGGGVGSSGSVGDADGEDGEVESNPTTRKGLEWRADRADAVWLGATSTEPADVVVEDEPAGYSG
ncbi:MAG: hypothetical protein LBM23_07495 [Propionibacteriaceae bacterium]|jgi:hypothetical protein|nr:hypothetical protein [Propionibacteriaceae bacterium]